MEEKMTLTQMADGLFVLLKEIKGLIVAGQKKPRKKATKKVTKKSPRR